MPPKKIRANSPGAKAKSRGISPAPQTPAARAKTPPAKPKSQLAGATAKSQPARAKSPAKSPPPKAKSLPAKAPGAKAGSTKARANSPGAKAKARAKSPAGAKQKAAAPPPKAKAAAGAPPPPKAGPKGKGKGKTKPAAKNQEVARQSTGLQEATPEPEEDYSYFGGLSSYFGGGDENTTAETDDGGFFGSTATTTAETDDGGWFGGVMDFLYDEDDGAPIKTKKSHKGKGKGKVKQPPVQAKPKPAPKAEAPPIAEAPVAEEDSSLFGPGFSEWYEGISLFGGGGPDDVPAEVPAEVPAAASADDGSTSLYASLFGEAPLTVDDTGTGYDEDVPDDGLFGITYYFGAETDPDGEGPPAPPPPLPPLPPPPPPEAPPPPISRLRPWAPQLRAASRARQDSVAAAPPQPKTDPELPPHRLEVHVVTADRRRALAKELPKAAVTSFRDADAVLCVADTGEDKLSEPESQGSAESISGDIARSWDPVTHDNRWHYSRDRAVPYSDPWRPLNWGDAEWMKHLKATGSYHPTAREDARKALRNAQQEEEDLYRAAVVQNRSIRSGSSQNQRTRTMPTEPAAVQEFAYSALQEQLTPRSLRIQSFQPVPSSDPVVRPALADALAAYNSQTRGLFGDARMEMENRFSHGGESLHMGPRVAAWEEPDPMLDKPGRAWI